MDSTCVSQRIGIGCRRQATIDSWWRVVRLCPAMTTPQQARTPMVGDEVHYCTSARVCRPVTVLGVDEEDSNKVFVDISNNPWVNAIPFCNIKCPTSWHWADRCPDRQVKHLGAVETEAAQAAEEDGTIMGLGQ